MQPDRRSRPAAEDLGMRDGQTGVPDGPDSRWGLALAINAAFKGLLASQGQSGHICARTVAVSVELDVESGWVATMSQATSAIAAEVHAGDVVVIADKVVAAALGRIAPRELISEPDPKTVPHSRLHSLAEQWQERLPFTVTPEHLLLADEYTDGHVTVGTDLPNLRAWELAAAVGRITGTAVDIVISDTDTGLDIRRPLIGVVTVGATPLGCTEGLNLYEAMRCAVAAEFTRGHTKRIPLVVCKPADRRRRREGMGQRKAYDGMLNAELEPRLAHA
jgi:hypothetical protein